MVASRENILFHDRTYAIAGNWEAEMILAGRTRVVRTVADSFGGYTRGIYDTVIREHEKMVRAFQERDPEGAGRAVFDHVTATRDRLLAKIAKSGAFAEFAEVDG
ncbi:FCD domain-containing protein [Aurantimonas sp. VKM B-3413]|uniref:FCD domain-containing protein n=1 Tax=Aurantimonas sp. VKM B-3413 TaxID=2779401 RepID=UPI001E3CF474|nr:FCD domain-containing protein [Aurantimonas sp. VKM B-3413]MCB8839783.1 FCD domain-containing protein [Aurantimonas sp. VKM B-3413]